ncbi:metallophosphoesterase [Variovorax sp. W2I14]|uniref:metallophosphoesterase n=1 Tax=Variovorax sp. W2I14 TaxID=3042290 RepID=UPI003D1CB5B7
MTEPRRRPWARITAALVLAALAVWGFVIEPRWVAARVEPLASSQWQPPAGLKVAMAGDWHLTTRSVWRVTGAERAARIVDEINAAQPDVILLPGDFLAGSGDDEAFSIEDMAAVLGRLKAPQGVYAVLGNDDWWHDGERTAKALAAQGIHVLENASVRLPGHDLWVVGIGDDSTGHSEAGKALAGVPKGAATLVMMHDPFSFATMPRTRGLVVASHTHGGQISVPGRGALVVPGRAPREWAYGWVAHKGNRMYVTSGLGVSILPVRFNMRPEWVMFQ